MALSDTLKRDLARLPLGEKLRLLFWLAEHAPETVRRGMQERDPRASVVILGWRISGLDPEGAAATEPDPPAALG